MRDTHTGGGPKIDLVEVGGRGGVFQHSVALAELLSSVGSRVLVHTASDHETLRVSQRFCLCFSWLRSVRQGRSVGIAMAFLMRTLPHLVLRSSRVVWVQGTFKPALTLLLLIALRTTGRTTLFSPHNLFSRTNSGLDTWLINRCVQTAHHVVVYNRRDQVVLRNCHRSVWLLPLVQAAPPVPPATLDRWQRHLSDGVATVAAIGQIREDKNIPLLLEAATMSGVRVIVVGPDKGALSAAEQRAVELHADALFFPGYHDLEDLSAVITLSGVVVCPYRVASQSGVARLAASYGAVVVATDVGGLREQADVVIEELTPSAVARAIRAALIMSRTTRDAPAAAWSESEKNVVLELVDALR